MLRPWVLGLYVLSTGTESFKLEYESFEEQKYVEQKWTEITLLSDPQNHFSNTNAFSSRMNEEVFTKKTKFDVCKIEMDLSASDSGQQIEFSFSHSSFDSLMFTIFCDEDNDSICVPVVHIDYVSISKNNSSPGFAKRLIHFFHKFLNSCSNHPRRRIELQAVTDPDVKLIGAYIWLRKENFRCENPDEDTHIRNKTDLELKTTELNCFAVYFPSEHILE